MPSQANQPLPEGTQLENYRILRVLAVGGFSFVYLAHDENDVPVAIKEYLPSTLTLRGPLEEPWLRNAFTQLLHGLREVHSHKLLHLDIKPGNVYIRNDGTPLLIDFGAARQALSAEGITLPPTYTPGFASPEQYARRELLGPWSDIYSVGATMYACLAAAAPQPADQRLEKDLVAPARRTWAGKHSADLLDIVDWCLRIDHMERPQSV